ncbi:hypothetical protein ACLOJK_022233 [Asimina triloba]
MVETRPFQPDALEEQSRVLMMGAPVPPRRRPSKMRWVEDAEESAAGVQPKEHGAVTVFKCSFADWEIMYNHLPDTVSYTVRSGAVN